MGKRYDREFKLEAIRMATEEGAHATEVERRLGIGEGMISRWKRQLREQGEEAFPGTGHLTIGQSQDHPGVAATGLESGRESRGQTHAKDGFAIDHSAKIQGYDRFGTCLSCRA